MVLEDTLAVNIECTDKSWSVHFMSHRSMSAKMEL
jgi:hypothetical protein